MRKFSLGLFLAVCLAGVWPAQAMAPRPARSAPLVLVTPARLRALQAAFDLQRLRGASLFAYRTDPGRPAPDVFQWQAGAWRLLAAVEFEESLRLLPDDACVALVGGPGVLPEPLATSVAAAAPKVRRFPTLQPVEIFNGLDDVCRFTPPEWEWLAARYELMLTDENAPRRAYNPYAVRQSELPLAADDFPVADDGLPPAEMEWPAE